MLISLNTNQANNISQLTFLVCLNYLKMYGTSLLYTSDMTPFVSRLRVILKRAASVVRWLWKESIGWL